MKIIVLGAPGAGKGTQLIKICAALNIKHISTGDIFRDNISKNTELGIIANSYISRGNLVPDSITCEMVTHRISQSDCKNGYALDGFPRTLEQAKFFQNYLDMENEEIDFILDIEVSENVIIDRICGRRTCLNCGATYHIDHNKPKKEAVCDFCGNELIKRKDDEINIIKSRLEVYHRQTQPLINYYKQQPGKFISIDGNGTAEEVGKNILTALGVI